MCVHLCVKFIDGRLDLLNSGEGFSDVFEDEINMGEYAGEPAVSLEESHFRSVVVLELTSTAVLPGFYPCSTQAATKCTISGF